MRTYLAALAVLALYASTVGFTCVHAVETGPTLEAPAAPPLGLQVPDKRGSLGRDRLSCAIEDQKDTDTHVLLCRFEESVGCTLTDPIPLQTLMQRYEHVKFLMIGGTPEGCSRLTFTGSLKTN